MAGQSDFLSDKPVYCIDTSSIIVLRQSYPEDIFQTLHQKILPLLKSGKIIVLNVVLEELKIHEPSLHTMILQTIPKVRQEKYEAYILTAQQIIHTYYDGKGKSHNIKADPFVIACAKDNSLTVITEELGSDSTKMPYVCSHEGVKSISFIDFLRNEKITV